MSTISPPARVDTPTLPGLDKKKGVWYLLFSMRVELRPNIVFVNEGPVARNERAVQTTPNAFAGLNQAMKVPGRALPGISLVERMTGPAVEVRLSATAQQLRGIIESIASPSVASGRAPLGEVQAQGQVAALGKNAANMPVMQAGREANPDLLQTGGTMVNVTLGASLLSTTQTFKSARQALGIFGLGG